jgi:hypothetical protein
MIDPNKSNQQKNRIPDIWVGAINGLLDDSTIDTRTRLTRSISQCFEQSPYLGAID